MPIPTSAVPAVQDYLVTQFTNQINAANLTQPSCEVFLNEVTHVTPNDQVVVGGAHRTIEPMAMVGGGGQFWREERFTIEVDIECFVPGPNSVKPVRDRAYQILGILETAIRTDPSLGGLDIQAAPQSTEDDPSWDSEHNGACYAIKLHVAVMATL